MLKGFKLDAAARAQSFGNLTRLAGLSDREAEMAIRSEIATPSKTKGSGLSLKAADGDGDRMDMFIYDEIGPEWMGLIGATTVARALQEAGGKRVRVRINSPGGDVFEGLAVYSLLRDYKAGVDVRIDGLAASISSIIAMAGKTVEMAESAMFMMHDAWGILIGNAQDALDFAALLDKIDGQLAGIYANKSGRKAETFRRMMDKDTWFTAQEAMDNKLIDKVISEPAAKAAFDLTRFPNAPAEKLAALVSREPVEGENLGETVIGAASAEASDAQAIAVRLRLLELDEAA